MVKTTLAILNWNDLAGAQTVVPRIDRSLFHEVFVVDGGSSDGSADYFKAQGLPVHAVTEGGRGGAMRHAVEIARGDFIVFLSTDGEEDPADLKQFIALFEQGADLVIASRLAPGGRHKAQERITWMHRMLYLQFYTSLVNLAFGSGLTDCWNGYRGFRLSALRAIPTDAQGHLIEAQQTMRFLKRGMKVIEFPTREGQRVGRPSGNPILRVGLQHLVLLVREKLQR